MKDLRLELMTFRELCSDMEKKCRQHINHFPTDEHSEIKNPGTSRMIIYYGHDRKTWSLTVDGLEWSDYKNTYEIEKIYMNDESLIGGVIYELRNAIKQFDINYQPKRRALNF